MRENEVFSQNQMFVQQLCAKIRCARNFHELKVYAIGNRTPSTEKIIEFFMNKLENNPIKL